MAIDQPYGITLRPKRTLPVEEAELEQEKAELQEIELKRLRNEERHRDPLGELIDARICRRHHAFWNIAYKGLPVTVTHYYPDKNVAIDVFQVIGVAEKREIEFKRQAFKNEGIRYGALDFYMDVSALLPQIKKVTIWPFSKK